MNGSMEIPTRSGATVVVTDLSKTGFTPSSIVVVFVITVPSASPSSVVTTKVMVTAGLAVTDTTPVQVTCPSAKLKLPELAQPEIKLTSKGSVSVTCALASVVPELVNTIVYHSGLPGLTVSLSTLLVEVERSGPGGVEVGVGVSVGVLVGVAVGVGVLVGVLVAVAVGVLVGVGVSVGVLVDVDVGVTVGPSHTSTISGAGLSSAVSTVWLAVQSPSPCAARSTPSPLAE